VLVSDQNWRGLVQSLTLALAGVQRNMYTLDAMARPLTMFASTIEDSIAGRPASFSWRELAAGSRPAPATCAAFSNQAILDFAALEPGAAATKVIRQTVSDLKLDTEFHARVRLTVRSPSRTKSLRRSRRMPSSTPSFRLPFCWAFCGWRCDRPRLLGPC